MPRHTDGWAFGMSPWHELHMGPYSMIMIKRAYDGQWHPETWDGVKTCESSWLGIEMIWWDVTLYMRPWSRVDVRSSRMTCPRVEASKLGRRRLNMHAQAVCVAKKLGFRTNCVWLPKINLTQGVMKLQKQAKKEYRTWNLLKTCYKRVKIWKYTIMTSNNYTLGHSQMPTS